MIRKIDLDVEKKKESTDAECKECKQTDLLIYQPINLSTHQELQQPIIHISASI